MKQTALAALMALAMACAHGGKAGEEKAAADPAKVATLKALHPAHETSGMVVLYRNTAFGGLFGPIQFNGSLWLDDQAVGDVHDDTYNVLELAPGRHSLRVLGTAPGIVVPLQTTTIVNVAAGQVTWLELKTVQEFNNATVVFRPATAAAIDAIATDCHEGFTLDLGPTTTSKL
jgi:hypothetical protein